MLQRAASNAYSWWWASHVRTKQSKWLEQSLQDMGEKVEAVLKLIEEDGDSFMKKAEMYYKKRPEFINFIEESYRAYRSLAERYDLLSKELQNANNTLASAFPDQYQYQLDDDEDEDEDEDERGPAKIPKKLPEKPPNPNIPKAPPKFPTKSIKAYISLTSKPKKAANKSSFKPGVNSQKSGLSKSEAINEVDKLQKQILTLQTEKEFAKNSYESGYAKYWQIEEEIAGIQETISKLQDEFEIHQAIEDDEARTLMVETALKSCQETLAQLQAKQERAASEAKAERERIKAAREKLVSLKGELLSSDQTDQAEIFTEEEEDLLKEDESEGLRESKEMEILRERIKEHFDVGSTKSLSVSQMAEKVDELVNKVIDLETAVSSQTALIHRLRSETDDLQSQIKSLEDDTVNLIDGKNTLSDKLREMESKLKELQNLNRSFETQNSSLETHFTEARSNIDTISEKLHDIRPDEEVEETIQFHGSESVTVLDVKREKDVQDVTGSEMNTIVLSEDKEEMKVLVDSETDDNQMDEKPIEDEHPEEIQPDFFAQIDENSMENQPSTIEAAQSQASSDVYEQMTLDVAQKNESSSEAKLSEDSKEHNLGTVDAAPLQEECSERKYVELVIGSETQQWESASLSSSYQEDQERETEIMVKDEVNVTPSVKPKEEIRKEEDEEDEDEPNWQQLFMKGLEGKEKLLLAEYTSTLRNYKEARKKFTEIEKKTQADLSEITAQLQDLRSSNAKKDEEIRSLQQRLHLLQKMLDESSKNSKESRDVEFHTRNVEFSLPLDDEDTLVVKAKTEEISPVEQKLRADIDEILEENLDFWIRFSASFSQVQKFQTEVEDLHSEIAKLEKSYEKKEGNGEGSSNERIHKCSAMKSDIKPLYKHLREIQTVLTLWLEQCEKLRDELQSRFSELCNIQEDINQALNAGAEDEEMKFTSYQAAKFQGEVANMQQENNKVADELQAGIEHVTGLQIEVERTLNRLNEELGLGVKSRSESQMKSRSSKVPLRSFIFGAKSQKKKQSIFSFMHPIKHRRYQNLKSEKPL